jgi:DNA-binding NtrC family response regulator
MSTAYGIIKQHGGNIWAYSEPGRGTTIKVYLPVPAEPLEAAEASPRGMEDAHGVETILLAEDDQQVRALAAAVLERYGYRVLAAGSGREALSALEAREGPIHLLLTDVIMPDMNGKELFNKVSQIHPNIRVLYMSGYTDNVIAHHGVIDPGVNFIEKPFTVKALSAKVREALDK